MAEGVSLAEVLKDLFQFVQDSRIVCHKKFDYAFLRVAYRTQGFDPLH